MAECADVVLSSSRVSVTMTWLIARTAKDTVSSSTENCRLISAHRGVKRYKKQLNKLEVGNRCKAMFAIHGCFHCLIFDVLALHAVQVSASCMTQQAGMVMTFAVHDLMRRRELNDCVVHRFAGRHGSVDSLVLHRIIRCQIHALAEVPFL